MPTAVPQRLSARPARRFCAQPRSRCAPGATRHVTRTAAARASVSSRSSSRDRLLHEGSLPSPDRSRAACTSSGRRTCRRVARRRSAAAPTLQGARAVVQLDLLCAGGGMSFGHPLLLLTAAACCRSRGSAAGYATRRRMQLRRPLHERRGARRRRRQPAPGHGSSRRCCFAARARRRSVFAVARPHVRRRSSRATRRAVILVLDVSGSMQAEDVKPTRLDAAQRAIDTFLDEGAAATCAWGWSSSPARPIVATPPTTDHDLVRQSRGLVGRHRTRSAAPRSATRSRSLSGSAARSPVRPE